jgi:hypothetical protein
MITVEDSKATAPFGRPDFITELVIQTLSDSIKLGKGTSKRVTFYNISTRWKINGKTVLITAVRLEVDKQPSNDV